MGCRTWNFDIDRFLNPLVPPPPWRYFPYPVAHFLGHRRAKPHEMGNLVPILWAFFGILCAILVIEAVSRRVPAFEAAGAPIIVGSFGAAAVLEFYSIESPLAQPRSAIIGQLIATVVGVCTAKIFRMSDRFDDVQWVGGALACALSTALMALTKTVHPPAGATALLAVVDANLARIGWLLLPVVLLGCALMLAVALLVNNLQRRFPMYWWTPEGLPPASTAVLERRRPDEEILAGGGEKLGGGTRPPTGGEVSDETSDRESDRTRDGASRRASAAGAAAARQQPPADDAAPAGARPAGRATERADEVVIRPGHVVVPAHMYLTQEEEQLLETLSFRL